MSYGYMQNIAVVSLIFFNYVFFHFIVKCIVMKCSDIFFHLEISIDLSPMSIFISRNMLIGIFRNQVETYFKPCCIYAKLESLQYILVPKHLILPTWMIFLPLICFGYQHERNLVFYCNTQVVICVATINYFLII